MGATSVHVSVLGSYLQRKYTDLHNHFEQRGTLGGISLFTPREANFVYHIFISDC